MIKIQIDTNIIIDFAKRSDYYHDARNVLALAMQGKCEAYLTATTITDIFYILKKENKAENTIIFLKTILQFIDILDVDESIIINALLVNWKDFEDAVQYQAATENSIDIIVTRNTKDFRKAVNVRVLSPKEFIENFNLS
jgi:predicted nucleic acid-binding protein